VIDAETLTPISGAQIYFPGSRARTRTASDGSFELTDVPIKARLMEVRANGYADVSVRDIPVNESVAICTFTLAGRPGDSAAYSIGREPLDSVEWKATPDSIVFMYSGLSRGSSAVGGVTQIRNPIYAKVPEPNLASVEVVRAAAATVLYGPRASLGVIKLVIKPSASCRSA
jgi:hypothetical protein